MKDMDYTFFLEEFNKTGNMFFEPIMLYKVGDENPAGNLRYMPKSIKSVMNSGLNTNYVEGIDYEITGAKITALNGSKMPYITDELYFAKDRVEGLSTQKGKDGIGNVLYSDTPFIIEHQIAVWYEFDKNECNIEFEDFHSKQLKSSVDALKENKPINLVLFGDSITCGHNSSRFMNIPPYLPTWGELIKWKLDKHYGVNVNLVNAAVGGMNSDWGVENVKNFVLSHKPQLTILAFGMNDGTQMVSLEKFKNNIKNMIDQIGSGDFILVSPILANPESEFVGLQEYYYEALKELESSNIKTVNMSSIHKNLLINKRYIDYSGNNINHPNDFIARCYAINILKTLIEE